MGRVAKIILVTFGWVVLLIMLLHWIMPYYTVYTINGVENLDPNVRYDTFKGFSWFFDRMAQFPGFTPFIKGLRQWFNAVELNQNLSKDIMDLQGLELICTICKYMVTPFYAIGLLVYNIAILFGWLISWIPFY